MINMISAFTEEIDDVNLAISEISGQLGKHKLKKNSIGILHCYHEFIDSGVVKALSEELPFDIIGTTVPYACLPGKASSMGLMLNIFTGDDVNFFTGISDPIDGGNLIPSTEKLCADIGAKLKDDEKLPLLMAFGPFMHVLQINGDDFVDTISGFFPDSPIFGAFSQSEEIDFSKSNVLYNGKNYGNAAALIAFTGNIEPSFLTISVPEENILGELAVVTKSKGNIINTINEMSVRDYVTSIGLLKPNDDMAALYATPMIATLKDGSTIVRVCIGGDGQGGAIMGGHVPVGAKIGVTMLELSDTVSTSDEIAKKAKGVSNGRNIIVYSCIARLEFLGTKQRELEAKTMCDIIGDSASFFLAYSGGEIFPERLPSGKFANHLQNYSLVVCIL
jgi:hypothetical protein